MGSGAPRELNTSRGPDRVLDPRLASKLTAAVEKLDAMDPDFKQARDDERMGQLAKAWGAKCEEIDAHLRTVGHVLINSHQIALDMGSDGGGRGATPWIEETSYKFPRLEFAVDDESVVTASSGGRTIDRVDLENMTYDWIEAACVEWIVTSIEQMG